MNQDFLLHLLKDTLTTTALVAAPVLLAILVVGLVVSILQVATQIQEMTLSFVPKLAVTVVMLLIFGDWMMSTLRQFAVTTILESVSR
ncbi:MAG: Flagellar biosynthetic protein [Microvirga sp.]|jgi:flagellar biosynthetic protein FliQ|nr:Flagellar biosynthetic protein [Microvirga sp.]